MSVLLGVPETLQDDERRALEVLADVGLAPRLAAGADSRQGSIGSRLTTRVTGAKRNYSGAPVKFASSVGQARCRFVTYLRPKSSSTRLATAVEGRKILRLDRTHRSTRGIRRPVIGAIAGLMVCGGILAGNVQADPADDALAKLNELSRQAEQTTEAMHCGTAGSAGKGCGTADCRRPARRGHGSGRCGRDAAGNVPERRRQGCCRAVHGWSHRRPRRDADRSTRRRASSISSPCSA